MQVYIMCKIFYKRFTEIPSNVHCFIHPFLRLLAHKNKNYYYHCHISECNSFLDQHVLFLKYFFWLTDKFLKAESMITGRKTFLKKSVLLLITLLKWELPISKKIPTSKNSNGIVKFHFIAFNESIIKYINYYTV